MVSARSFGHRAHSRAISAGGVNDVKPAADVGLLAHRPPGSLKGGAFTGPEPVPMVAFSNGLAVLRQ